MSMRIRFVHSVRIKKPDASLVEVLEITDADVRVAISEEAGVHLWSFENYCTVVPWHQVRSVESDEGVIVEARKPAAPQKVRKP